MTIYTEILINRFSVTLCYYGTVFYLPKLDGQRHVNFLIGAFIEVVAYLLAFWALSKFGRRWPTALYQILCGAICATVAGITFYTGHHQGTTGRRKTFFVSKQYGFI